MNIKWESRKRKLVFACLAGAALLIGAGFFVYSYTRYQKGTAANIMSEPVVEIGHNSPSIIKETFDSDSYANYKATFEAGETVFVRLTVEEPSNSRADYKIEDTVPSHVSGTIDYVFRRGGYSYTGRTSAVSGKIVIEGKDETVLLKGKNYFEYSYKI